MKRGTSNKQKESFDVIIGAGGIKLIFGMINWEQPLSLTLLVRRRRPN